MVLLLSFKPPFHPLRARPPLVPLAPLAAARQHRKLQRSNTMQTIHQKMITRYQGILLSPPHPFLVFLP